ncbi:M23 family metallopeptidase [Herbaspirillum sp. alder98]|uniref:M23 family metallopeptidase n=1 Tax=Herbaspirillum sp. alder98 TaxID=2913096 RepID=UPI001CD8FFA4|nr:M23 family metallopeptidase [Herbaspirillum sp. alder98]MCA1324392.1 M23 family metallopeptidase [Herbaspirillum sp. alder98]
MFSQDKFTRVTSRCLSVLQSCHHRIANTSAKTRIVGAGALFLGAFTLGAAGFSPAEPDLKDAPVNPVSVELPLPNLAQQISTLEDNAQYYVNEEKVRSGDTLATLLNRLGVDDEQAASFIKSDTLARSVMQLRAGKRVVAQTDDSGELVRLSATLDDGSDNVRNLVISRDGDNFKADAAPAVLERRVEMRSGIIFSSLFAATDVAQIPDGVAMQLVDMFATNINFASDLRRGDRFNVVYETFWQNGDLVRTGRVLAGEFDNAGNRYQAVWFNEPGNKTGGGYYAFDGKSLKKAFLKSPLAFTRISSGFSMRLHPILGQWKQHTGVDFAAPTGTPIHAAADGVVDFVGQQNGYGNIVVIKHWSGYSTAYGHMSRFASGIKKGMKVGQNDVIGFVGMTGWATGPHLHYEFRVNNQPRNPLSVEVPNNQALTGPQMQRFRTVASDMQHRMAMLRVPGAPDVKLASR